MKEKKNYYFNHYFFTYTYLMYMQEQLMDVYERLEDMAADTAEARAAHILHGLGFTAKMQQTPTKDFSGGWRMRIALARCVKKVR